MSTSRVGIHAGYTLTPLQAIRLMTQVGPHPDPSIARPYLADPDNLDEQLAGDEVAGRTDVVTVWPLAAGINVCLDMVDRRWFLTIDEADPQ